MFYWCSGWVDEKSGLWNFIWDGRVFCDGFGRSVEVFILFI